MWHVLVNVSSAVAYGSFKKRLLWKNKSIMNDYKMAYDSKSYSFNLTQFSGIIQTSVFISVCVC